MDLTVNMLPKEKLSRGDALLFGDFVSVVIVHFVIIPGEEPGAARVHGLKIGVGSILAVTQSVLLESFDFGAKVAADIAYG